MKRGVLIIGVILLVIALVIGYIFLSKPRYNVSPDLEESVPSEEKSDYVGEQTTVMHKDFRAIIKADWREFEVRPSNFVYLPPNTAQDDISAEVISIITTYLGGNNQLTLDDILEQGIENSKQVMPDFELTENVDWETSHMLGKKIKFTGTQEGVKRNNVQVFGIKNNILYAITYSCPVESCNSYPVFNTLVESFEPVVPKNS